MTVTSNTTRNDYVAGTNQNVYNYTFQLNEASDVTVYLGGVVQTLNTHYTVQNVGVGTGGTITFTLVDGSNNPIFPTPGTAISIVMAMDLDRDTDYQANGAFLAADVNNDYDRLWLATNQQQTAINRSLRLQDDDVAGASPTMELPLKDDRKGKLLGFHATTGEPITAVTLDAGEFVKKAGDTMTGTLSMGSNKVTSSATPSATSDLTNKQYVDAAVAGVPVGDITAVTAGTGMTGGGTTGDVTLNVIGGTGITANADDISVDNTVVLTTGLQTLGGKSFSNIKLVENGDTKVQWPFGLNDDFFFADNQKVLFGIDMQLYHDGSNSYIKDVGTGNLYIDTNSSTHLSQGGNDKVVITSDQVTVDPRLQFNTLRGAGAIEVDIIRDEDDMSSDDPDALATQQSIKAYVDSQAGGDITAVTAGAGLTGGGTSGDVTLNAVGGTGITVNADDIQVTDNGIGATQLNVSGNGTSGQLLASDGDGTFSWQTGGSGGNETLAQTLALGNTTGGTDISVSSGDNIVMAANSTVDGRDVSVDGTKLDGIEASADVTDTANVTAAGALMDSELTSIASVKALNQGVATTDSPAFAGLTVDTDTLAVDSTNNRVGIGTSSPARTLHLKEAVPSIRLEDTDVSGVYHEIISEANTGYCIRVDEGNVSSGSYFRVDIDNSEKMRIDSSGNVGIGTSSPSDKLHVSTGSDSDQGNIAFTIGGSNASNARTATINKNTSTPYELTIQAGKHASSGIATVFKSSDATETMRIDSSGNVGIGTTSPAATLDVAGSGAEIAIRDTRNQSFTIGDTISSLGFYSNDTSGNSGSTPNLARGAINLVTLDSFGTQHGLSFKTRGNVTGGAVEHMRIDSSGNLGIGTTSPAEKLHVSGNARITGAYTSTTGFGANVFVQSTGKLFRSTSSARYKNSIEDVTHGLAELLTLRPVTYKGNEDGDTVFSGLIAEEVHDAGLTEFVQYNEEGQPDALAYGNMVSICIKAIQEQQTLIESLTARIAALEA